MIREDRPSVASPEYLSSSAVLPAGLPFSEAVRMGDVLYLSGQIGNIPGTLQLVPGGIKAEARQVMENIKSVLTAHGLPLSNAIKVTVMMADMKEWASFNEVYREFFHENQLPARSAFGTSGLAFNARVEVECVAACG